MKRCAAAAAAAAGRCAAAPGGSFATPATATVSASASAAAASPQRRYLSATRGLLEQDHYGILGLPKSASQDQVKKAYLSLAKKHHPDAAGGKGNSDQFNKVNEAYKTLNDPQKRQVYDMSQQGGHGSSFAGATGAPGAGAGFDARQQGFAGWDNMDFAYTGAQGGQQTDRMGTDLGKMWEDIFGSGAAGAAGAGAKARVSRYQPKRGEDVTVKLHLGFVEAVEGTVKEVSYFYTRRCHPCKGTGSRDGAPVAKCTVCGGRGKQSKSNGYYHVEQPCAACNGAGEIVRDLCAPCGGKGSIKDRTTQQVTVPAGVNTKDRLRVAGKGEAGIRGGAAGNLYIDVVVENDSVFVRDGYEERAVPRTQQKNIHTHTPVYTPIHTGLQGRRSSHPAAELVSGGAWRKDYGSDDTRRGDGQRAVGLAAGGQACAARKGHQEAAASHHGKPVRALPRDCPEVCPPFPWRAPCS